MKGPGRFERQKRKGRKNGEINKRERNNNSIRACMYRTIRSMNGIKINFLLVTYRLSSNASFLTFATDRTRSISFES